MSSLNEYVRLLPYGYAPGNYMSKCFACEKVFPDMDKRATRCRPCAEAAFKDHEIERLRAEVAGLKAENAHARDCLNSATTLLTGIHSLMYPPEITTADGRVMVFRPKSIDPHEILQGLSDRIRALPDELAALAAQKGEA